MQTIPIVIISLVSIPCLIICLFILLMCCSCSHSGILAYCWKLVYPEDFDSNNMISHTNITFVSETRVVDFRSECLLFLSKHNASLDASELEAKLNTLCAEIPDPDFGILLRALSRFALVKKENILIVVQPNDDVTIAQNTKMQSITDIYNKLSNTVSL
jgi:hypothetical protein